MSINGYYVLYTSGAVLFKKAAPGVVSDFENSDLVRAYWPVEPHDRAGAWRILVEACALGADLERVAHLARTWHCDDADAVQFCRREGIDYRVDAGQHVVTLDGREGRADHALTALVALYNALH